jgi:hypothetical protein
MGLIRCIRRGILPADALVLDRKRSTRNIRRQAFGVDAHIQRT